MPRDSGAAGSIPSASRKRRLDSISPYFLLHSVHEPHLPFFDVLRGSGRIPGSEPHVVAILVRDVIKKGSLGAHWTLVLVYRIFVPLDESPTIQGARNLLP